MLKRVALFLATNLAVILVLSIVLRLLGVDRILDESGAAINYEALLVLSLVIGFGGSFMSLAMSKWMAKRSTGAQVITQPRNEVESWLLNVVERQARQAGIETPEVAIYAAPDMNAFAAGPPAELPESMEAFGISGSKRHGIQKLFMSHPPIEERIEALQNA